MYINDIDTETMWLNYKIMLSPAYIFKDFGPVSKDIYAYGGKIP